VDGRERLLRLFAAEEVASALRHKLVNKISAVGALSFHLRRQLPEGTPAAATQVLPMIDAEVSQATQILDLRFLGPPGPAGAAPLGELVEGLLGSLERPAGVEVVGPQGPAGVVAVDRAELDLALFCLVENALESGGRTVAVRWGEPGELAVIEVADDGPGLDEAGRRQAREPFFTTKPGRLGVGLNVAGRIAQRWRGTLELAGGRRGLVARLSLPVAR